MTGSWPKDRPEGGLVAGSPGVWVGFPVGVLPPPGRVENAKEKTTRRHRRTVCQRRDRGAVICDVLFDAPRRGRAARYRENRAVQPSRTPDKKHANGAVCRPLPKKKQGQRKEATPLCPSANSSAPHAQQVPKPVASVLRCRTEMVMIVEVETWSRRPVLRTGAAGAPTRKENPGSALRVRRSLEEEARALAKEESR